MQRDWPGPGLAGWDLVALVEGPGQACLGIRERVIQPHLCPHPQAPQMYPYPVSNSVPGQQGKYRGAKGEQGWEGQAARLPRAYWQVELELSSLPPLPGSLPPQRSDQHQPASAPPMMQAAAAAGPPLVAATPYSSYIPYNPQQFPGQPAMMQPMAHYPSQVTAAQEGSEDPGPLLGIPSSPETSELARGGRQCCRWDRPFVVLAVSDLGLSPGSGGTCNKALDICISEV